MYKDLGHFVLDPWPMVRLCLGGECVGGRSRAQTRLELWRRGGGGGRGGQ
jgi:hypothetical protein